MQNNTNIHDINIHRNFFDFDWLWSSVAMVVTIVCRDTIYCKDTIVLCNGALVCQGGEKLTL